MQLCPCGTLRACMRPFEQVITAKICNIQTAGTLRAYPSILYSSAINLMHRRRTVQKGGEICCNGVSLAGYLEGSEGEARGRQKSTLFLQTDVDLERRVF